MDQQVRKYLNANAIPLFIDEVMGGDELKLRFNDPLKDSRTPDIIVRPNYGTIYTGSTAKNAEHGGFNYTDTNVGLIVSNPSLSAKVLKSPVTTAQVAPTILRACRTRSKGFEVGSRGGDPGTARAWNGRDGLKERRQGFVYCAGLLCWTGGPRSEARLPHPAGHLTDQWAHRR